MASPAKENLMMKDQARKEAKKLAKRKPFPVGLLLLPAIIFVFALVSFGFYLYLDRSIENTRQEEFEKTKRDFENTPAPEPNVVEGRKLYFIWKCELYEYDVDREESKLISAEVQGFKDIDCFDNTILTEKQEIIVSKSGDEIINGTYFLDFSSSNILNKLEISSGADLNAFDFDSATQTIFQGIKKDAVYSINYETKEVKKIKDLRGFDPSRDTGFTDEFSLSFGPGGNSLLQVDSISVESNPLDAAAPKEEVSSISVFDFNGKEIDSADGTFARWVDATRIVYFPYKKANPKVVIRSLKSKSEVEILPGALDPEKLRSVSGIASDPETSQIAVTYLGTLMDLQNTDPETYLYDNSTGTSEKLKSYLVSPEFFMHDFLVGYSSDGVDIYNLKTDVNKIIIGK